jgi:hypothetical protein
VQPILTLILAVWHALTAPHVAADPVTPKPASRSHVRAAPEIPIVWRNLIGCEAGGRWRYGAPDVGIDPGYDFEGGPNFEHSTWLAYRLPGYPLHAYDATPWQQVIVGRRVLAAQGVDAWPECGPKVHLQVGD